MSIGELKLNFLFDEIDDSNLTYKKKVFLKTLKGDKLLYKRYTGSPLRYAGGKSWAVGYIIENLPNNIKRIVSPFIGGASFEVAVAKELDISVLGFDIFDILVNYWQIQIKEPENLYLELKQLKPNHETYYQIKDILKKHWKKEIKLEIEFAKRFEKYLYPKASVAIDGISFTLQNFENNIGFFTIIPYTYKNTTISLKKRGDLVNVEFDVLAKIVENLIKGGK